MDWVLAPLRNADGADRWAGERARKLVAGADLGRSGWRGRDLARGAKRRDLIQLRRRRIFLGGAGAASPSAACPVSANACHRSNCAVPITGSPTACGPARVRSVVLVIDGLSGIDGTRGLRGIRSISVKGRPPGSGRRERQRKTQSGEGAHPERATHGRTFTRRRCMTETRTTSVPAFGLIWARVGGPAACRWATHAAGHNRQSDDTRREGGSGHKPVCGPSVVKLQCGATDRRHDRSSGQPCLSLG